MTDRQKSCEEKNEISEKNFFAATFSLVHFKIIAHVLLVNLITRCCVQCSCEKVEEKHASSVTFMKSFRQVGRKRERRKVRERKKGKFVNEKSADKENETNRRRAKIVCTRLIDCPNERHFMFR